MCHLFDYYIQFYSVYTIEYLSPANDYSIVFLQVSLRQGIIWNVYMYYMYTIYMYVFSVPFPKSESKSKNPGRIEMLDSKSKKKK